MAYADLLKDPRWQKKRLEILSRDDFTCQSCGDTKSTLNVHHAFYQSGRKPWEYPNETLITWCEACHALRTMNERYMASFTLRYTEDEMRGLVCLFGLPWSPLREMCQSIGNSDDDLEEVAFLSRAFQMAIQKRTDPETEAEAEE